MRNISQNTVSQIKLRICSTFISLIEIVEHKKRKFLFVLLPFLLFSNQTSDQQNRLRTLSKKTKDWRMELFHIIVHYISYNGIISYTFI